MAKTAKKDKADKAQAMIDSAPTGYLAPNSYGGYFVDKDMTCGAHECVDLDALIGKRVAFVTLDE